MYILIHYCTIGYFWVFQHSGDMPEKYAYSPDTYDARIRRTIPQYDMILEDALDIASHSGIDVKYWVDVGAGTGNMAIKALAKFPRAKFTLLDISSDMLAVAKSKMGDGSSYVHGSSDRMDIEDCSADVVTCIQSNHYYDEAGHAKALAECYRILRPGGLLIVSENVASRTEAGFKVTRARIKDFAVGQGFDEEEVDAYLDRYGKDFFPHTVDQHLKLLEEAGFADAEVFFYSYGQAGFFAFRR